jgi:segregation and condensation protein B
MSLRAQLEAIIYAAETPITLEQIVTLVRESVVAAGATDDADVKSRVRSSLEELVAEFGGPDHGIEIRQVAGGYRMSTKPEQHEVVRNFAKSLKPPIRLSLPALETLAVIAYKQPVTVPEISEIRGVDSGGVIATLLDRKLITTAGRKQVIGRPILYKTTKEFLMRFGLKDVNELPSMEEFEKLVAESFGSEMIPAEEAAPARASEAVAEEIAAPAQKE